MKTFVATASLLVCLTVVCNSAETFRNTLAIPVPLTQDYYMDVSGECLADNSKYFQNPDDVAIIKAWSRSEHYPLSTCTMTFSAYQGYAIKFKLGDYTQKYINDCGVRLTIYSGTEVDYANMIKSYGCGDPMDSSLFQYTNSKYIAVHIGNGGSYTSFDFNFFITSYAEAKTTPTKPTTTGKTPMNPSTTQTTLYTTKSTTSSHRVPTSYFYYMDDINQCGDLATKRFYTPGDVAYIKAWSGTGPRTPLSGGCTMTFSSYRSYGMKFDLTTKVTIGNCEVTLNIYSGPSATHGNLLESYSCHNIDRLKDKYYKSEDSYITVELINPQNGQSYDFTLQVRNYDHGNLATVVIIALTVGSVFAVTLLIVAVICVRYRRQQRRNLASRLITTAVNAEYSYPVYSDYGSVSHASSSPQPFYSREPVQSTQPVLGPNQ